MVFANAFRDPRVQAQRERKRKGFIFWSGTPGGEKIIWGPAHPQFHSLSPKKSESGRKFPAAEKGEQMLDAHSRKLETQHPAAHPLSQWGPPLALTRSPMAGRGSGSVPTAAVRAKNSLEDSSYDLCFCPELSLAPLRGPRRVHSWLGKFGQAAVPLWSSTRSIWQVVHSGAFWI